jgi:hypothetical protein
MGQYIIFKNPKLETLVFYPVPKNANTSMKLFLAQHLGISEKFQNPNIENNDKNLPAISSFLPSKTPFSKVDSDYKVCIVRDPFERFISTFNNRILQKNDFGFRNHTIDMILEKLVVKNFENKHFLPQVFFLGKDPKYFTEISLMNNFDNTTNRINSFFGKNLTFPKAKTTPYKNKIILSDQQKVIISKIYQEDFVFINSIKKK